MKSLTEFYCSRYGNFEDMINRMDEVEGGIEKMALGHEHFCAHVDPQGA